MNKPHKSLPHKLIINPAWAARGEIVSLEQEPQGADKSINPEDVFIRIIDGVDQAFSDIPVTKSAKPSNPQGITFLIPNDISGGPKNLQLYRSGVLVGEGELTVLGDVDKTRVLLIVDPKYTEESLQKELDKTGLGLALLSGGLIPLGGKKGPIRNNKLALVDIGGRPLGKTLVELRKKTDFVIEADPESLWKIDPESVWNRGVVPPVSDLLFEKGVNLNNGGRGITIAILDTGIDQKDSQEQLENRILDGFDFTRTGIQDRFSFTGPSGQEDFGHGYNLAILAAGKESSLSRQSKILPIKVANNVGECRASDVIQGLSYLLAQEKIDPKKLVVLLSLGGDTPVESIRKIILEAVGKQVMFIFSVGNEEKDVSKGRPSSKAHYPASYSREDGLKDAIVVGAVSREKTNDKFLRSSTSRKSQNLDVVVPTVKVQAQKIPLIGTSFSAALIAGMVAYWRSKKPNLTPKEIKDQIIKKAQERKDLFDNLNPIEIGNGIPYIPKKMS
ncbi:MAG: S8/S53 family peptidase [Meiothermus sp.]|nr:S8/S53 family peptidase [Meiothermus sp.]